MIFTRLAGGHGPWSESRGGTVTLGATVFIDGRCDGQFRVQANVGFWRESNLETEGGHREQGV